MYNTMAFILLEPLAYNNRLNIWQDYSVFYIQRGYAFSNTTKAFVKHVKGNN